MSTSWGDYNQSVKSACVLAKITYEIDNSKDKTPEQQEATEAAIRRELTSLGETDHGNRFLYKLMDQVTNIIAMMSTPITVAGYQLIGPDGKPATIFNWNPTTTYTLGDFGKLDQISGDIDLKNFATDTAQETVDHHVHDTTSDIAEAFGAEPHYVGSYSRDYTAPDGSIIKVSAAVSWHGSGGWGALTPGTSSALSNAVDNIHYSIQGLGAENTYKNAHDDFQNLKNLFA